MNPLPLIAALLLASSWAGASHGQPQPAQENCICESEDTGTVCDDQGRVVRRQGADGDIQEFVYHPSTGKLILATTAEKSTEFHYDDRGQLTQARNSEGQVIALTYDGQGKISAMSELDRATGQRRLLTFKYNAQGQPIEIHLAGVGNIMVDYDDKGEIRNVSSNEGAKMALQVMHAFQNLLSVVSVAGVPLGL